ncbi:MAG TPA: tetratricopeptide repeat protein [Candidatus Limnocylindrales bacterium]|jgi:thioredoxin-like negative regulator of GroEL
MIELMLQAEQTLGLGLIDQAERLYAQAAAADPKNAIAVIGLARVQLERGDETGSHALVLRALAIDPENATALRMEARLREVLAGQGRRVSPPPPPPAAPRQGLVGRLIGRRR